MVGSTSPRSDSLSVADAASGGSSSSQKAPRSIVVHGHVLNGRSKSRRGLMAGLAPQNAWVSRARQARADLIADSNDTAASPSGRPTLAPSPTPAPSSPPSSRPKASARASSNVPVAAITGAAVGGVTVVAAVLALIYFFRIRRRVKRMKRCTDILGPGASFTHSAAGPNSELIYITSYVCSPSWIPELAVMSPSQSSQLSFDSHAKSDGTHILSPSTSDPTSHFLPLAAPIVTPPATVDRPGQPLSPIRPSTIIIGPPPTPRRGSILPPEPRSPIRSPPVTLTWPNPTPRSQHDQGERRASSD